MRLDNNFLTGGIPVSIVNLTNLERLYLKDNNLSGQIPAAICDIESLEIMWFHNNNLCPGEDGYPVCFPDFQIIQQDCQEWVNNTLLQLILKYYIQYILSLHY